LLSHDIMINIKEVREGEDKLEELIADLLVSFINDYKKYSYVELR